MAARNRNPDQENGIIKGAIVNPEFLASEADQVLTVVFKLLDRLENIVERKMRAFFYESASNLGFPQTR